MPSVSVSIKILFVWRKWSDQNASMVIVINAIRTATIYFEWNDDDVESRFRRIKFTKNDVFFYLSLSTGSKIVAYCCDRSCDSRWLRFLRFTVNADTQKSRETRQANKTKKKHQQKKQK